MRLLSVEDHRELGEFLKAGLTREGFVVDIASDGMEALQRVEEVSYDVILLDVMMPGMSGISVLKQLRANGYKGAILLVTCKGQESDKLEGLDMGADDYIVKPARLKELIARIRAVLRRTTPSESAKGKNAVLKAGNIEMDLLRREVRRGPRTVSLTKKEFDLLEYLLRHPRQVMSQTVLAQRISQNDFLSGTNVVEFHIKNLRSKLDAKTGASIIRTVRGCGYCLDT
jgi:two-component system, OmpR family, copper resistance phosphate regulon response regulator CusR